MLTLNFKSYYKIVCYVDQFVFYIVTFVYWNIVYIESYMYRYVLKKINKLQKKNCQICHREDKLIFNEMMMRSALF